MRRFAVSLLLFIPMQASAERPATDDELKAAYCVPVAQLQVDSLTPCGLRFSSGTRSTSSKFAIDSDTAGCVIERCGAAFAMLPHCTTVASMCKSRNFNRRPKRRSQSNGDINVTYTGIANYAFTLSLLTANVTTSKPLSASTATTSRHGPHRRLDEL